MQSDQAALVLARLIHHGLAAELPEALPPEWQAPYAAVRAVPSHFYTERLDAGPITRQSQCSFANS